MNNPDHKSKKLKYLSEDAWRSYPEFDNHEFVMAVSEEESGLKAFIAIHNTNRGPALGGTRMKAYVSEASAVQDVLNLSRAMSYKCALANLPYGGGKAVIMGNNQLDRAQVLTAYARLVEKLRGLFKTGTDVGISDQDVMHMAAATSHMLGVVAGDRGDLNTSNVAALGVFHGIKAVVRQLNGSASLVGQTVAIKGIGKLGGELTRLVLEAGGKVVVSDVNPAACIAIEKLFPGLKIVDNKTIHQQEVDVYAPCALGNEFNVTTIPQLRCKAIVGGANNQLENTAAGDLLHKRNILYAPDYIANAGGLIYVADELEDTGFNKQRVLLRTAGIEETLGLIFEESKRQNLPSHIIADRLGLERMHEVVSA